MPEPKKLVIAGGGHASLPLIKMGRKWKKHGIDIKLVSEHPYLIYSGALPQYMAGFYEWNQTSINLEKLCRRYNVLFTAERVKSINKREKLISTQQENEIPYDYLVINIGASTAPILEGDEISPVKPMSKLLQLREKILSGQIGHLLIMGAGAAGSELALNISHPGLQHRPQITLVEKESRILSSFPEKLSLRVRSVLEKRGVTIHTRISHPNTVPGNFDQVILAAGNRPRSADLEHSFKTGAEGRILTDHNMVVDGESNIFAAGDTADIGGENYPQVGVYAVKQGVTLRKNIKSAILGRPLKPFKPYPVNPLILSNGPNSAFFIMNRFVLEGRMFAVLKYILDMRWLDKYSRSTGERRSDFRLFRQGIERSS